MGEHERAERDLGTKVWDLGSGTRPLRSGWRREAPRVPIGASGDREAEAQPRAVGHAGRRRRAYGVIEARLSGAGHRTAGSVSVSPRPPQCGRVVRTGTSTEITSPPLASRGDNETSAWRTLRPSPSIRSPKNASQIRSTARPTEGKSMAISSAKHSCGITFSGDRIEQEPCPRSKNVRCAAGRCACANVEKSCTFLAIRMPRCAPRRNGFALTATTLKKPKERAGEG